MITRYHFELLLKLLQLFLVMGQFGLHLLALLDDVLHLVYYRCRAELVIGWLLSASSGEHLLLLPHLLLGAVLLRWHKLNILALWCEFEEGAILHIVLLLLH